MAEKGRWTRSCAVGARLIDCDEVAFAGLGKLHAIRQQVERRAQSAHDGCDLALRSADSIADDDGIVLAENLSEISGRGKMMMQSAIRNQEHVTARDFPVQDAANIKAGLADEVPSELDHEVGSRYRSGGTLRDRRQIFGNGREIKRLLPWKIRDAETPAEVYDPGRRAGLASQVERQIEGLGMRFADCFISKIL